MRFLVRLLQKIAVSFTNIEAIILGIMTILVFFQVVTRYIFSYSFVWVEALTSYLMIWMAFLGAATLFSHDGHIRMDFVYNRIPQRYRSMIGILFNLLHIAFLVMLFKLSLQYVESVSIMISPTLGISMLWPTLIIPISAVLMIFFILSNIFQTIISMNSNTIADD